MKIKKIQQPTVDEAWSIYNLINDWKAGEFGIIPLEEAIDKYYIHYI